jgi:activator of HSP90 ATPase
MKGLLTLVIFLAVTSGFRFSIYAQASKTGVSEHVDSADPAKGITIHQEVNFGVVPEHLYQALLSSEQFSACTKKSFDMFTASSARIDAREGGSFSLFDGHIIGRILELIPGKRIVEAWRVVDWPEGVYSIARFDLEPKGTGTQLSFDHIGFPEGLKEHLASGWQQHYWDALSRYFQGH